MKFSAKSFLRRCSSEIFQRYIGTVAPELDIAAVGEQDGDVAAWLDKLDSELRDQLYVGMERAWQLRGEIGQRSLREVAYHDAEYLENLKLLPSDESRALSVLIEKPSLFKEALAICHADSRRQGNDWSGYVIGDGLTPIKHNTLPEEFRIGLAEAIARAMGTSRHIVVEWFERQSRFGDGKIWQASIYAKGSPQTETVFVNDELDQQVFYPAVEASVTYEPETGQLDVMSQGGRQTRDRISGLFSEHIFGYREQPAKVRLRNYDLERIRSPMDFVTDAEDMIEAVWIESVRFLADKSGFPRVNIDCSGRFPASVWQQSRDMFGGTDPFAQPGWRLVRVSLRVRFHKPKGGGRQETLRFALSYPNGSNLKERTEHERLIGEKYLSRWGLVKPD